MPTVGSQLHLEVLTSFLEGGVTSDNWRGSLNYKFNGPVLTANFNFGN